MYTKQGVEEIFINDIRCLLTLPQESNGCTLFLYHGWGSIPENQVFLANILSSYGFTVLLPEIIHHGTRDPFDNPFDETILKERFWETVIHSVEEA